MGQVVYVVRYVDYWDEVEVIEGIYSTEGAALERMKAINTYFKEEQSHDPEHQSYAWISTHEVED